MIITKIISSIIEKGYLIIKILGFGESDLRTVYSLQPFGIDSRPTKGYRAVYCGTGAKEEKVLIGVLFPGAVAEEGEMRIHSEDSDGNEKASIYLKQNGDIELTANGSTTVILKENGNLELNGNSDFAVRFSELESGFNQLKSDLNSFITTYNTHVHSGVTTGPGSSGPTPQSGSSSAASIASAKIDNVLTN